MLKHHSEWRVTQADGGVMRWVSPTGREYVDRPPSRVRFVSSTDTGTNAGNASGTSSTGNTAGASGDLGANSDGKCDSGGDGGGTDTCVSESEQLPWDETPF